MLADARLGRSAVLAIVGEPGIGKTALLDYAAERAAGMRVLRARGVESETEVPFASLLELLRPALSVLDSIPAPQAEALAGALALRPAGTQDRFAIGAGTLSVLAAYADRAPLLVLVDDAHWLDGSGAEALLFAFRRLLADPIAVLVAARDREPSLLDGSDLPQMRLEGLDRDSSLALVGPGLAPELAQRLYEATGGNPLALLELVTDPARLEEATPERPLPVSASVANAFLRRTGTLPDDARRILLLAAAMGGGELSTLERAAAPVGLSVEALGPAEQAGLVALSARRFDFRHPLVRSAVYGDAAAAERRAAHRALADALPDRDVDRRAWHLAEAVLGPDERASAALEHAGIRARARGAYAVAAAAFERAARLAPDEHRIGPLLWAAADAAWNAGLGERALALLDEARAAAPGEGLATRIEHLRGHAHIRLGRLEQGRVILVEAAERASADDPERAIVMLAEASHASFYLGHPEEMLRSAERAQALLERAGSSRARFFAATALGTARVMAGDGETGAETLRGAVALLEASDELRDDPRLLVWAALGPLWLREAEAGRALIDRALGSARERPAAGALPFLLQHVARDHAMAESWPIAHATYHEAARLARESGQRAELAAALAGLSWLEARQGMEEPCREHSAEGRALCRDIGMATYEIWTLTALGELELGLGHPERAIAHFEEQGALLEERGMVDVDISPVPELVDAYLRLGRADEAAALVDEHSRLARAKGQPWALARLARCRGLVGTDEELDRHFGEALALHALTPDLFETARTHLAYGARLRRARRRVHAREELRAALALFDRLGPTPWAEQASAELAATGETARRRDPSTLDQLTPQELQIALLLTEGKTTRQTAAALFLSPKTIEYHLRHVYRKLGIRSREELAAAFAGAAETPAPPLRSAM